MISAAVQFYDVIIFVHVTAVVIGFGPTFAYGAFLATAQREGGAAFPVIGRSIGFWDRGPLTLAMTLVLLTGIYLAADGPYGMGSFFISWGFLAIFALFGLSHGYFIPKTKQAIALAERDLSSPEGNPSQEFQDLNAQMAKVGMAAGLITILTIYVMTAKPFL